MKAGKLSDEKREIAQAYFQLYIDAVDWRFAKTMSDHPHEYTVRWNRPDLDEEFYVFATFIRDHGYTEYFYKKPFVFFNIGEYKFWTYGDPIHKKGVVPDKKNTFILNRAKIDLRYGDSHDNTN